MGYSFLRVSRAYSRACLLAGVGAASVWIASGVARAQTVAFDFPLSDVCVVQAGSACTTPVIGIRTVTVITPTTITPVRPGTARATGSSLVDFTGQLQVDGIQLQPNSLFPSAFFQFENGNLPQIAATTQYVANFDVTVGPTNGDFAGRAIANPGYNFVVNSLDVDSISLSLADLEIETESGDDIIVFLSTPNPNVISNNSTALSGRFRSEGEGSGPIVFGTISGTAAVVAPPGATTQFGQTFISPFALSIDATPTITTQLDETGLVTPTVSVTNGIDMNGSKITELADGTAPTDAVNRRQLDVETTARVNADLQINQRIAVEEAARTTLAGQLTSETNARVAADMATSSQLGVIGSRVDQLATRVDAMEDRISGAAAVATAMSGNAFLPNMRFNMTANVATYDGAHAGSLQLGALVTPHVAVNAGVASGFNRKGKTAGRVGLTFGW